MSAKSPEIQFFNCLGAPWIKVYAPPEQFFFVLVELGRIRTPDRFCQNMAKQSLSGIYVMILPHPVCFFVTFLNGSS